MCEQQVKESVLEKVRKVLERTTERGASEAEAKTALLLAQRILAKNGLEMSDVEVEEKTQEIVRSDLVDTKTDNPTWKNPLANIIARAFRCRELLSGGTRVFFVGHKEDVAVCFEVYNAAFRYAYRTGWNMENKIRKEGGKGKGVAKAYSLGFVVGLKKAFDAQSKELMVLVPTDVSEYVENISSGTVATRIKAAETTAQLRARQIGIQDGESFMAERSTKVEA